MSIETLEGRKVLVVGGSGFLGRALVQRLAAQKARVVAMSRNTALEQRSEYVSGWPADAADHAAVRHAFRAIRPDIVFQLTSEGRGGRELNLVASSFRNDVVATVNLLCHAAAAEHRVERFVMTASLDEPQVAQWEDSQEPTPASPYAAAKWASGAYGRMFRQLYGLDVRIVRPMMAYGPGQKHFKVVPATILSLLRGKPARLGSGSRLVDWIYIEDVIDGIMAAALVPELHQTVDLGSGALVTVADCAREIARQVDRPDLLMIGEGARGDEIERAADVETARRLIGFSARMGLSQGLMRTIEWYRVHLERESNHGLQHVRPHSFEDDRRRAPQATL